MSSSPTSRHVPALQRLKDGFQGMSGDIEGAREMIDNHPPPAAPLGLIGDEFGKPFRQGKSPSVEEFARRYPEQADEIREILPALLLMEKAKSPDDTAELVEAAPRQ